MSTKFYVDAEGVYLGGFDGVHPPAGAIEVPAAPSDARQVWDFDGQAWRTAPVDLVAYAAQVRWQKEVGGIEVGGMTIHTDDRSKSLIMGARQAADADPEFTTRFKTADGTFVTVDAGTITTISNAVLTHVATCFSREADIIASINNGTITTTGEIDAAFA